MSAPFEQITKEYLLIVDVIIKGFAWDNFFCGTDILNFIHYNEGLVYHHPYYNTSEIVDMDAMRRYAK